jgi:hypothetical protein
MAGDRYPAVRRLAWRSARRLANCCADFDPSAEPAARVAAVAGARAVLGARVAAPDPSVAARLRAPTPAADLEIGE